MRRRRFWSTESTRDFIISDPQIVTCGCRAARRTWTYWLRRARGCAPRSRAALEEASREPEHTLAFAGRVKRNGDFVAVTVSARPVKGGVEKLILLSFFDVPKQKQKPGAVVELPAETSRIAEVEQELDATRKDLESAIHDREAAEEEIRAINEEAMSVNEEFQTTNEELETSKEELQSLNEELTALNSQLQETLEAASDRRQRPCRTS